MGFNRYLDPKCIFGACEVMLRVAIVALIIKVDDTPAENRF